MGQTGGRGGIDFVHTALMAAHLHDYFGAVVMADFGKLSHARDEFIVVNEDTSRFTAFTAAGAFDNQEAGAAFGTFGVIIQLLFGNISVMSRVVSAAGSKNDPIFQFDFAHFPGLKKFGKFRHAFFSFRNNIFV